MLWRDNNHNFSSEIVLCFTFFLYQKVLDPIVLICTKDRNTDKVTVKQQQPKKP